MQIPLIPGASRQGYPVFKEKKTSEQQAQQPSQDGKEDEAQTASPSALACSCAACGLKGDVTMFKPLEHRYADIYACPVCAGVLDISTLRTQAPVSHLEQKAEGKWEWNAEIAYLPEISQRNLNMYMLAYFCTLHLMETEPLKDDASAILALDHKRQILKARYVDHVQDRIRLLAEHEEKRVAGAITHKRVSDMDMLLRFLKNSPKAIYDRRSSLLKNLRIVPKDASTFGQAFLDFGSKLFLHAWYPTNPVLFRYKDSLDAGGK